MEETTVPQEEAAVEATTVSKEDTSPVTSPEDQLNALINRRMGEFEVKINYADLKYLKNTLNQKVEWKGPNEAYLTIISVLTLDNLLQSMDPKEVSPIKINMPASTIESVNFFLSRITGKGIEAAQRLFSLSMILRQPIAALKKIDEEIEALRKELQKSA